MNPSNGRLTQIKVAAAVPSPSWLAIHPQGRFLYAVKEISNFNGTTSGSVSAFSINRATGDLTFLSVVSSEGSGPAHLSVDPLGQFVYVANYGGGSIAVLPIQLNGSLGNATDVHVDVGAVGPTWTSPPMASVFWCVSQAQQAPPLTVIVNWPPLLEEGSNRAMKPGDHLGPLRDRRTDSKIPLRRVRLGNIVWLREEKYCDLLVWHVADVNGAMSPVTWLVPIDLPGCDSDMLLRTSVAEFNSQSIAVEHDRYAMEWISMPPRGLARREQQSSYQSRSTVMKRFLDHSTAPSNHSPITKSGVHAADTDARCADLRSARDPFTTLLNPSTHCQHSVARRNSVQNH
jgi:Lactonase, 7-bladed beta-propeller